MAKTAPVKKAVKAGVEKIRGLLGFEPAELATRYPEVAPPVPAVDKKTGKEFLQKALSPEAEAVAKVRKAAQKDIDKGNYSPYFNVEERYYADPANYPLTGTTITDALPKKAETQAKYRAMADTPEARQRLGGAYEAAKDDPLAKDWYAMGQLENEYVKELGPELGRARFREDFAESMAATTGGADPTSNLLMSYFGNFQKGQGLGIPKAAYEMPYPIGGRFASGNMAQYDKMINQGGGISAADNPKRFNFAADFMGYRDRPTIDEQMSGLFQEGLLTPPGGAYGAYEEVLNDVAKQYGVSPVNFQDVAWAGAKGTQGKPMISHVNEAIERTSRVTGLPPQEVVKGWINRRTPMYGMGGGALGGGLLGEDEPRY
jgi:hypothetical protein